MSSDVSYATLEEAFGVSSFLAPEPPVFKGNVAEIADARHKTFKSIGQRAYEASIAKSPGTTVHRMPLEIKRDSAGVVGCVPSATDTGRRIARAHARGGAEAAWNLVPSGVRGDMMWYAFKFHVQKFLESDAALVLLLVAAMYVLFK